MIDFQFLKACALDAFAKMAQPDVNTRLLLDGAMREATAYTLRSDHRNASGQTANVGSNAPDSHPIRQPWAGGSINRPSATPEQP